MNGSFVYRILRVLVAATLMFSLKAQDSEGPSPDYKLSPQDIIIVQVIGEKDLTQECRISTSGTISYAWLNNVSVGGKTSEEIQQILRDALDKDYLVNPTVIVAVKEYRAKEVTVMGFVNRPGSIVIPAEQSMTVVDAIGKAGGIAKGGNPNAITLQRRGQVNKTPLKLEDLQRISDPDKMVYVQPGDVIEVKERAF